MSFEIKQEFLDKGIVVFQLSGALSHGSYEQLKKELSRAFESSVFNLILDFSAVTHLSSIVLGSLFTHQQLLNSHDGTMVLSGCPANILAIFGMLSMDESFQISASLDEAKQFLLNKKNNEVQSEN